MTKKQIIKKSIEKALKNGYVHTQRSFDFLAAIDRGILNDYYIQADLYYPIIFSHSFAKAFWGDGEYFYYIDEEDYLPYFGITQRREDCVTAIEAWQYHLQQIVLEKEPLKYLEKYL